MRQLKKCIPFLLLLFIVQLGLSQTKTLITKDQQLKLDGYMKMLDSKVLEAFKKAPTVKIEMESGLKAIADTKDSLTKLKMIAAYQSKYSNTYSKILMAGGVTKQMILTDLQAILPQFNFTADSLFNFKASSSGTAKILSANATPTTNSKRLQFDVSRTVDCGGLSGGNILSSSFFIESNSVAGVAGGCTTNGFLTGEFTMPTFQMATLVYRFRLHASALAIGIAGTSASISSAYASFDRIDGTRYTSIVDDYHVSVFTFAPILWVSNALDEQDVTTKTIGLPSNLKKISVIYNTRSLVLSAICCASTAKSKVSNILSTINYQ